LLENTVREVLQKISYEKKKEKITGIQNTFFFAFAALNLSLSKFP
jgi:hypothetical protein